jgi:deazaflavin-dependent oxidoreductase (nitroreductase family)
MADRNEFNRKVIEEFRSNAGVVGPPFAGMPMILISHHGVKTGTEYTTPLVYSMDSDRYVVIASMGGAPTNPQWYANMVANGEVTVEVGTEKFVARVTDATGAERDRLYASQADLMPVFKDYAAKTDRVIPVLVLERVDR